MKKANHDKIRQLLDRLQRVSEERGVEAHKWLKRKITSRDGIATFDAQLIEIRDELETAVGFPRLHNLEVGDEVWVSEEYHGERTRATIIGWASGYCPHKTLATIQFPSGSTASGISYELLSKSVVDQLGALAAKP